MEMHNAQGSFGVNDKRAAQGNALVVALLDQDAVVFGDLLGDVRKDRDLHRAETAILAGLLGPGQVGELGVHRGRNHLGVQGLELGNAVTEGNDFRWADKGDCL